MRKKKWNDGYTQEEYVDLEDYGERIVETLGYIPRAQKIKNYEQAGINLLKFRQENYDGDMKSEDYIYNPYRDVGMDFSDYARNQKRLKEIVEKKYEAHKKHVTEELERAKKMQQTKAEKEYIKKLENDKNTPSPTAE